MCPSIREFGFKIAVLPRGDGEVVDGNLRLKAAGYDQDAARIGRDNGRSRRREIPNLNYQGILGEPREIEMSRVIAYLREELPYFWREEYHAMTPRQTNIVLIEHDTFT